MKKLLAPHPRGIYVLSFIEMWDRFSYYGTHSLIVLYLIHAFGFLDRHAYAFFGAYTALSFALPVLGGYFADRMIGAKRAIIIGIWGIVLGNALLLLPSKAFLYVGLAVMVCGIGLLKANIMSFVGYLYDPNDEHASGGFTVFYMCMNVGAVLGPVLYGFLAEAIGWRSGFLVSACGSLMGLAVFYYYHHRFVIKNPPIKTDTLPPLIKWMRSHHLFYLIAAVALIFAVLLFSIPMVSNPLLAVFALLVMLGLLVVALHRPVRDRRHILALLLLCLFAVLYFSSNFQTDSSVTLFLSRYVNRWVFGWEVPPIMFSALEPLFVILLAPLFIWLWDYLADKQQEPFVVTKVAYGSLLAGVCFLAFILATYHAQTRWWPLFWLVMGNIAMAAGELCIMPCVTAAFSKYSPANLRSTLMGVWNMSNSLAGYGASWMAGFSLLASHTTSLLSFRHAFMTIAVIMFLTTVFILLLKPWLEWLLISKVK